MSLFATSTFGTGDIELLQWTIIELPTVPPTDEVDRHIFGWSPNTRLWQLSSKILDEQETYIETRSRKYYKSGDQATRFEMAAVAQLSDFLHAWRVGQEDIDLVLEKLNNV